MAMNTSEDQKARESISAAAEEYAKRVAGPKDFDYFKAMFEELIRNNTIPEDILDFIPEPVSKTGKTRFDQLYDAAMFLVFPSYRKETLTRLIGPNADDNPRVKIWRVMLPDKFGLSHVLIRAATFQEAFSLGCDYACRMSLRLYHKIPTDLTIRIHFVSEKAIRRMLDMRWANRVKRRKQLQLEGREYTPKELLGARLAAIGTPKHASYSIAKYAENKDLKTIRKNLGVVRVSAIESETFSKD
jgi:hypothetical protein